jgi:hypothetical protein
VGGRHFGGLRHRRFPSGLMVQRVTAPLFAHFGQVAP